MDYTIIGFLVGIVTIVGFMYKFERDTREDFRREVGELRDRLTGVERNAESLRRDVDELKRDVEALKASVSELRERLGRVEDRLNLLVRAFMGQNEIMTSLVGRLEKRGVIEGADAWKTALGNITTIIGNPLTEEEKKRLLEFINKGKDEFTLEEADEFMRLAWRFWSEHMDMEEAWYLLYYAAAVRGRTYGRHNRELTILKLS